MSLNTNVVAVPNRGTRFADMCLGERTRCLMWARSHDWGEGATYDDDFVMRGLVEVSCHLDTRTWSELPAFAATLGGLRDWAGY